MAGSPSLQRVEWPNQNALRRYPLAVQAHGTDTTGRFTLPSGFLVDGAISMSWESQLHFAGFYVRQLTFSRESFRLELGHRNLSGSVGVCVGGFDLQRENVTYSLLGTNELAGTNGMLVVGDPKHLVSLTPGNYLFDYQGAAMDPSIVYAQPRSVRSLQVTSGGGESAALTGNVRIVPTEGTQFRVESDDDGHVIVWDAVGSTELRRDCDCDAGDQTPIRTIGGLPADASGGIAFFGTGCLQISPQSSGLQFNNTCSEPCCDCQEDTGLNDRIDLLNQQLVTMENRLQQLEARYLQVDDKLIGEPGCDELQCQPYDPHSDGALIQNFNLT